MSVFARLQIRTKLTLVVTLLLAIVSLAVFIYFPARLERQAIGSVVQNAAALTEVTAAGLGHGLATHDPAAVAAALTSIRRQSDLLYLVVTDASGVEFAGFNQMLAQQSAYRRIAMDRLSRTLRLPAGLAPSRRGAEDELRDVVGGFSPTRRIFQASAPVRYEGKHVGDLYIGMSLDAVHAATARSRATVALVTLIAFLVGVIAVYLLSTVITGPLQRIVETAESISAGDLSRRADVHASDEVGQLAAAFNSMIDRLHSAWQQLEEWGHTLEAHVDERTKALKNEVEERTRAEEMLRLSEERYRLLFERNLAGVYIAEEDGRIITCNDACARIFGYDTSEAFLEGDTSFPYVHERDRDLTLRRLHQESAVTNQEVELRSHSGASVWALQNVRLVRDEADAPGWLEGIILDISDRKRSEEEIAFKAYHDALTALPNRALFLDRLEIALAHAQRMDTRVAVLFLDLDDMKSVNDTLGHAVGDQLLRLVAMKLFHTVRRGDTVARVGGDEFLILLSDLAEDGDAERVATKIVTELREPFAVGQEEIFITASIGLAMYPRDGQEAEDLVRNADGAMYDVKQRGGDAFTICRTIQRTGPGRLSIEQQIRSAIERDEFVVFYQPQVVIATRALAGAEALVRWQHPGSALIEPAGFIPAAEHAGLIAPIGEIVMRKACEQMVRWKEENIAPPRVAVNVSARQFYQRDFLGVVDRILRETRLDARYLELEITETVAMQKTDRSLNMLHALRERGITIAIDDFGTGQSSLTYLKRFPIDTVKIDKSFVMDIEKHGSDEWIVTAVLMLAKRLGLRTIAEGVETQHQHDFLREHGCAEVQGYLISRPLSAVAFANAFLRGGLAMPAEERPPLELA